MEQQLRFVEEVEALAQQAPRHIHRGDVETEVEARVKTYVDSHTDQDGVLTIPRSAIEEYRGEVLNAVQRRAAAWVSELERTQAAALEALSVAEAAHSELPSESQRLGENATDQIRLTARLVDVQETDAAVRQLAGRSPAEISKLYEATPDSGASAAMLRVVERAVRDGWRGIDVVLGGQDDAFGIVRLQRLISERRAARQPAWLKDARARVERAVPATLRSHATIIKSGQPVVQR